MKLIAAARQVQERDDQSTYLRIPIVAFGWSLSVFAVLTYSLCIALMFVIPDRGLHKPWLQFLPFFDGLSFSSFLIGLAEVFVYSWYIALVFAPIYNFFAARSSAALNRWPH
jgi:hypothetical protein